MQQQVQRWDHLAPSSPVVGQGGELWRGSWVIFTRHFYKFLHNGQEVGGTLAAPLLLAATFGLGMDRLVTPTTIDGLNYLSILTPGVIALLRWPFSLAPASRRRPWASCLPGWC